MSVVEHETRKVYRNWCADCGAPAQRSSGALDYRCTECGHQGAPFTSVECAGNPPVEHRLPDVPIKPSTVVDGAWETWCACGWGAMSDSPEALAIGIAEHREGLASKAKRLAAAEVVIETLDRSDRAFLRSMLTGPSLPLDMEPTRGRVLRYWDAFEARLDALEAAE